MTLEKECVTLPVKRFRQTICKRDEKLFVFAMERRHLVNRSRYREVETTASVVAAPEQRTARTGCLHTLVPLEDARSPRRIKPLPGPPERKLVVAHKLDARIVDTVRRDGDLPLAKLTRSTASRPDMTREGVVTRLHGLIILHPKDRVDIKSLI